MRYALLLNLIVASFCAAAETRPHAVTSFLPLYCWAANVAGDKATVENLLSAQVDAHDHSFTPGDARRLNNAALVIVNGMGMEDWLKTWQRSSRNTAEKLVMISSALPADQLISGNPHVWLDPQLACVAVTNIASAFARVDPANATAYAANAAAYVVRLQQLDAEIRTGLRGLTNRAIVTYHDAFPYFARRYGLEVAAVVEQVAGVNPTGKSLTRLKNTMREKSVRAIFVPPKSSSRVARRIAEDLNVPLAELDTIEAGELAPDTYERAMRANLKSLQDALK